MTNTHDTIDGLLAEFRGYAFGMPASYRVTMSWADFCRMLDRFDAAHRRERGDAAKLREALEKIAHYDDDRYQMDDYGCADGHICADIARQALGIEGGANG